MFYKYLHIHDVLAGLNILMYCLNTRICCTTGFKIELPNARAGVCLVTDHLIYQPARRRCSLQAELLHVIKFLTIFAASPAGPSIKVQRICQFSRQYSRKEGQNKLERQASNSHWSTKQHLSGQIPLRNIWPHFSPSSFAA
jgi:hypothetical protein